MAPDKGASPERTRLSWRRTSLSATVAVVLLWRLALHEENRAAGLVLAAATALAWVAMLFAVQRRVRALSRPMALRSTGTLMLTTAACTMIAIFGAALVVI